jgi:hypothetical protein
MHSDICNPKQQQTLLLLPLLLLEYCCFICLRVS